MVDYIAYQFAFCIATLVVCLTCLIFTFIMGRTDRFQNRLYILMVSLVAFNSLTEAFCSVLSPHVQASDTSFIWFRILQILYFITHTAIPVVLVYYVRCVTGKRGTGSLLSNLILLSPFLITEVFIFTNPLTHWVYFYTERNFNRNWAENLIYIGSAFYMLYVMMNLLNLWKAINPKRRGTIMYFFLVSISGILIQALNMKLKVELLAEALGFLGIMLAIEDEDDMMDTDADIHNRKALLMDMTGYIANRQRFFILAVKITNADVVTRITNVPAAQFLGTQIGGYLKTLASRHDIYRTAPDVFLVVMMDVRESDVMETARIISDRFEQGWVYNDKEIILNAIVMIGKMNREIFSVKDIVLLADSQIPKSSLKKIMSGEDLSFLIKHAAMENAVNKGLAEKRFEVFYQPTYYLDDLRLHGAEALIRLRDEEMGLIFPDEFIPVAEQLDHIDEIDDFVLKEVCEFIKSGVPKEKGIETINVNLSVIECMRPGFVDHVIKIVNEAGVDKRWITFEITESLPSEDYAVLSRVIMELKQRGFHFAMDDYGTGYSNMLSIFSIDFDLVKIDKSILWGAEKTELGRIILENSVRMIRQMNKKILVEGVETVAQVDLLRKQGVDYLQGFFFSKPVPKDVFLEIIDRRKK